MSGASVSSTRAVRAGPRARRRICSARSKVIAPPKPSLRPSPTNTPRLLRAAVEGVRDAAGHLDAAQQLRQPSTARRLCSSTGRANSRASQLLGAEALLPRRVGVGREAIEADLADGNEARVAAMRVRAPRAAARGPRRRRARRPADGCRAHRPRRADARAPARCRSWPRRPRAAPAPRPPPAHGAATASRSASNSAASRWQCVSIHAPI